MSRAESLMPQARRCAAKLPRPFVTLSRIGAKFLLTFESAFRVFA